MHRILRHRQCGWPPWSCSRPDGIVQGTADYPEFPQTHGLWFLRFTVFFPLRPVIHLNHCFSLTRRAAEAPLRWAASHSQRVRAPISPRLVGWWELGKQETSWFQSVFANPPKLALKAVWGPAGRRGRILRRDGGQRSAAGALLGELSPLSECLTTAVRSTTPHPPHTHKGFGKRERYV